MKREVHENSQHVCNDNFYGPRYSRIVSMVFINKLKMSLQTVHSNNNGIPDRYIIDSAILIINGQAFMHLKI